MSQSSYPDITAFLKQNPSATHSDLLAFGDKLTKHLIKDGKYDAAVVASDALIDALNTRSAAARKIIQDSITRTGAANISAATSTKEALSGFSLSKGISTGKATAIVAGVGLLAVGAYAFMRKKDEPSPAEAGGRTSWVNRVEQQRMRDQSLGRSVQL